MAQPERDRPSLVRQVSPYLAAILFLVLAAGALTVVLGWVEVRRPEAAPQAADPAAPRKALPASAPKDERAPGPSVERVPDQEGAFLALFREARVFRYRGGAVRCWVETSSGGKKKLTLGQLRTDGEPNEEGVIVWLVREGRHAKQLESGLVSVPVRWDLGIRVKMVRPGGSFTTRLRDGEFTYPAPEADKGAPEKAVPEKKGGIGGPSLVQSGEIAREDLEPGRPVRLYFKTTTNYRAQGRGEVAHTLQLMCELLAPPKKAGR
jgi:hypothetical protein